LGGSPSARPGGGNSRLAAALPEAEFAPAAGVRPSQPAAADVLDRLPPPADGQRLPPAAEVARELAVTDAELPGFSDNRPVSSGLAPIAQSPAAGDGAGRVLFGDLPVAPTHPRFGEEVLQRIRIMVDDGIGQARLRLNPPELGALDIRISLTDDRATVHFAASHALARDSLEAGLPRLRELLEAAGISLAEGQVSARQGSAEQQAGGHAAQPPAFAVDFSTPDSDPAPGPYRQLPAGRVDLYA
jgi:flagellar hook-length control protein FliK